MTQRQAIQILIQAAQRELRHLTFSANVLDRLGHDETVFRKAAVDRKRLLEAIEVAGGK